MKNMFLESRVRTTKNVFGNVLQLTSNNLGEWFTVNAAAEIISRQTITNLSIAATIHPNSHFTLLFPGEKLLLTTVKLPKMRKAECMQAIPYLLEEKLISDPEHVYVAMGDTKNTDECVVAVLEKTMIDTMIATWKIAKLFPQYVLPDFLAIYYEQDAWSIVIKNKMAMVRMGWDTGFKTDCHNLLLMLQSTLEKNKMYTPRCILCWLQDDSFSAEAFETFSIPIVWMDEKKHASFDWASLFVRPPIQLLQGKYRPKMMPVNKKHWQYCALMASVLLLSLFCSQWVEWMYFSHQVPQLKNRIALQYRILFPDSNEIIAPHARTENLLKKYTDAEKNSVFLKLFGTIGKTIAQFPGLTPLSFHFDGKQLQLQLQSNETATLTACIQRLRSQGFIVTQKIVQATPNVVVADVQLNCRNNPAYPVVTYFLRS